MRAAGQCVCTAVNTAAPTHALTLTEWIDHCVEEVEERGVPASSQDHKPVQDV